jgi:hypothetical protein
MSLRQCWRGDSDGLCFGSYRTWQHAFEILLYWRKLPDPFVAGFSKVLLKARENIKLKMNLINVLSRYSRLLFWGAGCVFFLLFSGCNSMKISAVRLQDGWGRPIENARIEFKSRGSGQLLVDAIAGPTDKSGMAALNDAVYVNGYTYVVVKKDDWRHAVDSDGFVFEKPSTLVVKLNKVNPAGQP